VNIPTIESDEDDSILFEGSLEHNDRQWAEEVDSNIGECER
jgi:hypothetical protein